MNTDIIPISDEQAKAIQEAFKFGGKSLDTARAFGRYAAHILGTAPEDLAGLLGGDWLRLKRAENIATMAAQAHERLEARRVEQPQPVSLSLALPLLEAAADEDRDELVDLWARLLAAAMDPSRSNRVRQSFIDIVKKMDPIDAVVLLRLVDSESFHGGPQAYLSNHLGVGVDEIELSIYNLINLNCIRETHTRPGEFVISIKSVALTVTGREFLRVVKD